MSVAVSVTVSALSVRVRDAMLVLLVSALLVPGLRLIAGQQGQEHSFFESGSPLRRSFELLETRPHVMITCTAFTVITEVRGYYSHI